VTSGPTTADFEAERARLAERIKKKATRTPAQAAQAAQPVATSEGTEGGFGQVSVDYVYDPTDKRDPFKSYFMMNQKALQTQPAGPLEQFELAQLSVTALVWDANQPRALVADPRGQSFIVREGSRIGKNSGRVIHIGDELVLVKETYVDFSGEQTTKDVELRIRVSQGG
jgi:type IV pilus assembly protein PilP